MSDSKKVKLIRIGDLEPECPKCKMSNAMLTTFQLIYPPGNDSRFLPDPPHADYLICRDCGFSVREREAEIEEISMEEGQERLRKYGGLFIFKG